MADSRPQRRPSKYTGRNKNLFPPGSKNEIPLELLRPTAPQTQYPVLFENRPYTTPESARDPSLYASSAYDSAVDNSLLSATSSSAKRNSQLGQQYFEEEDEANRKASRKHEREISEQLHYYGGSATQSPPKTYRTNGGLHSSSSMPMSVQGYPLDVDESSGDNEGNGGMHSSSSQMDSIYGTRENGPAQNFSYMDGNHAKENGVIYSSSSRMGPGYGHRENGRIQSSSSYINAVYGPRPNGGIQNSSSYIDAGYGPKDNESYSSYMNARYGPEENGGVEGSSSTIDVRYGANENGGVQSSSSDIDATISSTSPRDTYENSVVYYMSALDKDDSIPSMWKSRERMVPSRPRNAYSRFQQSMTREDPMTAEEIVEAENDPAWETIPEFTTDDIRRARYVSEGTANYPDDSQTSSLRTLDSKTGLCKYPKLDRQALQQPSSSLRKMNGILEEEYSTRTPNRINNLNNLSSRGRHVARVRNPFKSTPPNLFGSSGSKAGRLLIRKNITRRPRTGREVKQSARRETIRRASPRRRPRQRSQKEKGKGKLSGRSRASTHASDSYPQTRPGQGSFYRRPRSFHYVAFKSLVSPFPKLLSRPNSEFVLKSPPPAVPRDKQSRDMYSRSARMGLRDIGQYQPRPRRYQFKAILHPSPRDSRDPDMICTEMREKASKTALIVCSATFVLLPIYAAGGLDSWISSRTNGIIAYYSKESRRNAWFIFAAEIVVIVIIIVAVVGGMAAMAASKSHYD